MRVSRELSFVATTYTATHESVEEDVSSTEDYNPEASVVIGDVGHITLDSHHHSTTEYHRHEDTTCNCCEATKTFYSEVYDAHWTFRRC